MNIVKTGGFIFCLLLISVMGCNPLDKTINQETLKKDIAELKGISPKLDGNRENLLDELLMFVNGRDAYMKKHPSYAQNPILSDLIIPADEYDKAVAELFAYFKAKSISFGDLFNELTEETSLREKRQGEFDEIQKQVDKVCPEIKAEWDKYDEYLRSIVGIKLINIHTILNNNERLVQLDVRVTNKTSKPIKAIKFALDFYDKFGNKIVYCKFDGQTTINQSDVLYFPFNENIPTQTDNFNLFRGKSPNMYDIKTEILKINHGGEILPAGSYDWYHNHAEPFEGFCPYLPDNHELAIKKNRITNEITNEVNDKCPAYSKIIELRDKITK